MNDIELIKKAKEAYYNSGEPIMSDAEYDLLVQKVGYESVGAPVLDHLDKIKITDKPMLSLNKCHSAEEIEEFAKNAIKGMVATTKCDGLSVRIIYENGEIVSANTRGDGEIGQDITEHIKQFKNVPLKISKKERMIIDGEAVILKHDFEEINKNGEFKNPRNLAAGTLASLDTSLCKSRRMSFIAWDWINTDFELYFDALEYLYENGFTCPALLAPNFKVDATLATMTNEEILKRSEKRGIPCDGVVWKFNDIKYGNSLGQTAHHFNNGIAWKPAIKEYETKLIDIEWTMGRSGVLTPVAVYEDIDIDGSTCNRASLHNISIMYEIMNGGAYVGETIKIFKANEIIPQISWAEHSIKKDVETIPIPDKCPICGGETKIKNNDGVKTLWCTNPNCEGKLVNRIDHYCGKKGMDIRGLSKATIEKLIDWGYVEKLSDIYTLQNWKKDWISKPGFGEKSVSNILGAIETSKNCGLSSFISAIGIPLVGRTVSREICKYYATWDEFRDAVGGEWSYLDGFGPEIEKAINNFDYTEADKIAEMLTFEQVTEQPVSASVQGMNFVITGKLSRKRDDIAKDIVNAGGKVTGSVSSKTNYLVCNDKNSTTGKSASAKKLGIPVIDETELMAMLS